MGDLDRLESHRACGLRIAGDRVGHRQLAHVDAAVAPMDSRQPGKAALERLDRPPRATKLDPAGCTLKFHELDGAVATRSAFAVALADGDQLQCFVQLLVTGSLVSRQRETIGFLPTS